jgi:hypothetical protein
MTYNLPLRRMILQSALLFLMDALTFITENYLVVRSSSPKRSAKLKQIPHIFTYTDK